MTKNTLLMLALMSFASPACVITTTPPRDVGSVNSDGTVYLGWNLVGKPDKSTDQDTYLVGANNGTFSAIRLNADKPVAFTQVLVIFADGERWVAPAPATLGAGEITPPIPLPNGPRAIYSIVVSGAPTADLLSKVEINANR